MLNNKRLGYVKGEPNKYLKGHQSVLLRGRKRLIPYSDEYIKKQRDSHLGRHYNVTDAGREQSRQNAKTMHTPEAIAKMRATLTGRKLSPEHTKNSMRRRPITSLEEKFQNIIKENGLPYRFVGNGDFIIDGLNPDFININGEKIAIEVYARFYKELKGRSVEKYKSDRIKRLEPFGWKIHFFDETQVNNEFVLGTLGGDSH